MKKLWRIPLFVLILVSVACSTPGLPLPGSVATPTATPQPIPPAVVETVPQIGSELGLQATLLIYFSEAMDKASVESALTSNFVGGFLFSWADESTLALTPKSAYPADEQIDFTLAASAKAANGLSLPEPLTFSYQTAGPLRVSQMLPVPQTVDVSPDSAVVVAFNQPVVALGEDSTSLLAGFSIEPAAQGKGEWLNTSTYIFRPEPSLAGGVDYNVRVNSQLAATSGAALSAAQNNTWVFRTSLPRLLTVTPIDAESLPLDPELHLTFNQPMERASVETGFALTGPSGKLAGSFTWNDKSTVATFKPSALLERASLYMLTLSGEARSRGGSALGSDTNLTYQTVESFGISSTSFPTGTTRPSSANVSFTFTAPLADYENSELESLITVSPEAAYSGFYMDGLTLNVNASYDPGQRYTITFSGQLKDRWGQPLGQDYVFTFRQPDADPSIGFGFYWPALFTRPDAPRVDVQAVNVGQLRIVLGNFSLNEFFRYQSDYNYQQGYIPDELDSWNEQLDLAPNESTPYTVDLSRGGRRPSLAPGLYYLDISSRGVQGKQTTPLLVSNVNLTLKASGNEVFVWAIDLRTQSPAANAPVTLYDDKGNQLASGTTDAKGIWQSSFSRDNDPSSFFNVYAVLGQPGDDLFGMASDGWGYEISPWHFGLNTGANTPKPKIYIYTERPVYRPGDTVHYRGIIHSLFNGRYSDAAIGSLSVALNGPSTQTKQNASVSAYGSFNGEFKLSDNAIPGYYSLDAADGTTPYIEGQSVSFQVADYRKPEINLSVALSPSPAVSGQTLTGKVNAAYFFEAPVNDLPFTWRLYKTSSYFEIPGYSTGLYRTDWYYPNNFGAFGETLADGNARTSADGSFSIPLGDIQVDDISELTLEITASESGGFPVSARTTVTMHPANFHVGIRPDAWFGRAGSELGFDVLTVDLAGKTLPNKTLTASFQKVAWERTDLPFSFEFTPIYTLVESKQITTGADGAVHVAFTPDEAGTYMLEIAGDGTKSQTLSWVGGAQNATWPNLPYQRMELTADKDKYKPGETAAVFIPNPFDVPALALITTERSSVFSSQIVSILPEGHTFNLPLSDDQAPNTYVSVTLLGPNTDFRQGYVNLPVEPVAFKLNVDLKATPENAKPGDQLTIDLRVTDSKGQPMQGEFSMAVVDLAALALAEPNSQEIVPAYYDIQPLGVSTGLTAAIYARRMRPHPAGGGGGGGGDPSLVVREEFPDTAYWKADIVTDVQGKAQIMLTLPDSLTTWQVEARGLTQDTKVGQAQVRVVTGKELLIRPQTPRFLVVGDHAELAAFVNNTTSAALEASVSLQASGFSLDDPATAEQKVQVPANGRIRVAWRGVVQAADVVNPVFTVKAPGFEDASRPVDGDIPVLRYSAPQTFTTAGVLSDAATRREIIALPKTFQPLGGKLDVELSTSLTAVMASALDANPAIPEEINWSNERLASDFLLNLATYQVLKDAGAATGSLRDAVSDNIRRLLSNQSYIDGGWSWVTGLNEPSDPYLTAYILFALNQISKTDLDIDVKDALERGANYLVAAPPFDPLVSSGQVAQSDLSQPWALNRAVFHNYVLQQIKSANLDTIDTIYAGRDRLEPWARALLAETLLLLSPSDERARSLLSDLQSSAIRSATGAHWEGTASDGRNPNSPLFNTAIVVYILAQRDPSNPMLVDAARYLVSQRDAAGRWGSSYEQAWIYLALAQYIKASGEQSGDFKFSAALNGVSLGEGDTTAPDVTFSAPLEKLYSNANSLLISRDAGTGKLYYRAILNIDRPVESARPLNQGISVSREFLSCSGTDCQPVTSFQMPADVSGRVKVQLTVTLPNDAYYLMVEDYIPAGAEMLDSSLKTSQQGEPSQSVDVTPTPQGPEYDTADPFSEGWGWWYFNNPQVYSDHILWSADYLPAGTYLLTYTIVPSLPGEYRVLPAHAWQAYFPEVQGTSAGAVFEIKK